VPPKALAKTTSAQSGAFVMTMPYAGTPVDVVVHAQGLVSSQLRDAYLYFPDPLSTDRDVVLELLSEVELKDFSDRAAVPFSATTSLVEVVVTTAAGVPASGATVSNQPSVGTIRYGDGTGHPVIQAIATDVDGLAFLFSGQPGDNIMTVTTQGGSRSQGFQIVSGAVIYLPEPLAR
jgi:hypothetical protein